MSNGINCMWIRGGTSKGAYFLAQDLPADRATRDQLLLEIMGSPDSRQIDGIGGADPLTSKVAIVSKSERSDADVEYLFLQVFVDQAVVSDAQNCGNILAGVGPFAIERGLVAGHETSTNVRIFMKNSEQMATALVPTPNKEVSYQGEASIDGVPGTAAAIEITFKDIEGSCCGSLLPTGKNVDVIDGVQVTCIDNGMPVVVIQAQDLDICGDETRAQLEANQALKARLESIRLQLGPKMNLGDVRDKSVPKMTLVSPAKAGGAINTRTFIPHRCHASIGVLGAVSVASAILLPASPARKLGRYEQGARQVLKIEHPIGAMTVILQCDEEGKASSAAILRTARKLFDGKVFAHSSN